MKEILTNEWTYSDNNEYFFNEAYDRKEDAIADCLLNYGKGYVGQIVKLEFTERDISYDETGHLLREVLYDKVGDVADSWGMTDEQEIELSKILAKEIIKYINKNNLQPSCYRIINIEKAE